MRTLTILLVVAGFALSSLPASANDRSSQTSIRKARASYAYAPRHHHHHYRGAMRINPRDPIKRALDDPYMYGRPDRH